jgi:hypothetical protein
MALLMTDMAAGGQAARQLQQNVIGAQYDPATAAASAEETQLKLQQDRLAAAYAPQKAAQEAEQEKMRLDKMRLQRTMEEAQYKSDTDTNRQLEEWLKTDEGKKADRSELLRKAAVLKMTGNRIEEGAQLFKQAESIDAVTLANEAKTLAANNESIGKAFAAIDAVPDYQVDQYFEGLPEPTKKLVSDQVGKENWMMYTGAQKKQVVGNLFANASGLLRKQIVDKNNDKALALGDKATERAAMAQDGQNYRKEIEGDVKRDVAMQQSIDKVKGLENSLKIAEEKMASAEKIAAVREQLAEARISAAEAKAAAAEARAEARDAKKDDSKDFKSVEFYYKERDRIETRFKKDIEDAKADYKKYESKVVPSTWESSKAKLQKNYEAKIDLDDPNYKSYSQKVNKFFDLHNKQYEEEKKVLQDTPDFPSKARMLKSLDESIAISESQRSKELGMGGKIKLEAAPVAKEAPASAAAPAAAPAPAAVPAAAPAPAKAAPASTKKAYIEITPEVRVDATLPKDTIDNIKKSPKAFRGLDDDEMWGLKDEKLAILKIPKETAVAAPASKAAVPSNKSAAPKFEEGKVYTDANGNKAKYVNGKWEPQ